MSPRIICWFSCGATSAVAAHLTLKNNDPDRVHIVYCDTGSEHPDNARFLADCERWYGRKIEIIKSTEYANVDEVIEKRRYISGIAGAPCTGELKRKPRLAYQRPDDIHIFGYHIDERPRLKRFIEANPELTVEAPLIDAYLNHNDCLALLAAVGIEIPTMYKLGFGNNNCQACVKTDSPGYWNLTRTHFPEVFARRAAQSRELGVRMVKVHGDRIYLDELPPDVMGNYGAEPATECNIFCQIAIGE